MSTTLAGVQVFGEDHALQVPVKSQKKGYSQPISVLLQSKLHSCQFTVVSIFCSFFTGKLPAENQRYMDGHTVNGHSQSLLKSWKCQLMSFCMSPTNMSTNETVNQHELRSRKESWQTLVNFNYVLFSIKGKEPTITQRSRVILCDGIWTCQTVSII